ncbi:MAG: 3'-5' exonuclease [Lachnospiraceae bacterium]|nr:3'-5' exonuclease [Lachnospiraceae bacterium]
MCRVENYIAIDIETTGLTPKTDRIIEIGAVRVRSGEIVEKRNWLINPKCKIPEFVVELTGISDEMVCEAPTIDEVMPEFIDFCDEEVIIGHHIITDFSFLKRNAVNLGMTFEKKAIDTLRLARIILAELERKNLAFLCGELSLIDNMSAHRAMDDAVATIALYNYMWEHIGENEEYRKLFVPLPLRYVVKKESPATAVQKKNLRNLLNYHGLSLDIDIDSLTKNEASRHIDNIIKERGRIPK